MFGLKQRDLNLIKQHLLSIEGMDKAYLFGSRAMGNYKKGSDVDIAVLGSTINRNSLLRVIDQLNENAPIPYFIEIIDFNTIVNKNLKDQILSHGILICDKKNGSTPINKLRGSSSM